MARSTLLVMPTGTGKTVVMGSLVQRWPNGRILLLAHREELIFQAAEKLERCCNEPCGIEMANSSVDESHEWKPRIVCASVQTLNSTRKGQWRMKKFDPMEFSLLLTDEAHHATAESYRRVYEWFGRNPNIKHLGVTATPDRADEEALGQIFETVAYDYELLDAIDDGWLVPIEQQFVTVEGLDLSQCKSDKRDLKEADVARVMQQEGLLHKIADPIVELSGDLPTLVFTASVAHAHSVAEIINRHKPGSAIAIDGETPKDERREMLKAYSRGDYQYLINMGVFLEGFDEPRIGCVAMARPTKSRSLYAQVVGRGTRPLAGLVDGLSDPIARRSAIATSGKPSLLVLDFVGNAGRHKLVSTADILSGNESDVVIDWAVAEAKRSGAKVDMREAMRAARARHEEEERLRREQEAKRAAIRPKAKFTTRAIDPFAVLDIIPQREAGWFKGKRPTERQLEILRRFKVPEDTLSSLSQGQAGQLMTKLIERARTDRCTLKQANILQRYGLSANLTFAQAGKAIDAIAATGWKSVPAEIAAMAPGVGTDQPSRKEAAASSYDF